MVFRLAAQLRPATRALRVQRPRQFSVSALRLEDKIPKAPPPIEDSTSALNYKYTHSRPAPLPATDLPRSRTAEEAVTNILYNTPPPSLQPFKKYVYQPTTAQFLLTSSRLLAQARFQLSCAK